MKRQRWTQRLGWVVVLIGFVSVASLVSATEDTFSVTVNANGAVVQGGGSGYEGGKWYYYSKTRWWNQWFYDGPLDLNGKKTVEYSFHIRPLTAGAGSTPEVAINWSSKQWSSGPQSPPIQASDEQYIVRQTVFHQRITSEIAVGGTVPIEDFCPEWVSIDVRGTNFVITNATINHSCTSSHPTPTPESLKWEQPPIEWDPLSKTPTFCGWDELSYSEEIPGATESSAVQPADDFRCLGAMPVTSVHWWGSYQNWTSTNLPAVGPDAWRITFSADVPADPNNPFSRPGTQLWQFEVPPDRVRAEWAGIDRFIDNQPSESCFKYSLALRPAEVFWQSRYGGDIFWISITAVYRTHRAEPAWGWKTRPWPWMGGAVETVSGLSTTPSGPISFITLVPVTRPDACGQKSPYDMAFTLDTDPTYVKWEQPFTGLRDWPHYEDEHSMSAGAQASSIAIKWVQQPDLSKTGVDMDATTDIPATGCPEILADDFECTSLGPVTGIEIWGSWYQDILPGNDENNATFTLSIRKDVPATAGAPGYSMPGKILWSKAFPKGRFAVTKVNSAVQAFASACGPSYSPNNHQAVYKYSFPIEPNQAFRQEGTTDKPVVYWLSVQAELIHAPGTRATRFGWKTSQQTWNDVAVWAQGEEPYTGTWRKLSYPAAHALHDRKTALAFQITTSSQSSSMVTRQVADDWACTQAAPVVGAVWWGSYLGYTYEGCACNTLKPPVRPEAFQLSIWSDVPKSATTDFSRPGQLLWEHRTTDFDEVLVGFDKQPELAGAANQTHEPVFRYSVKIPSEKWFFQKEGTHIYWFSVVALYDATAAPLYPWGWTNHSHSFNDDAVAATFLGGAPASADWQPLKDQTGASEDMSFVLFQQLAVLGPPPLQ